MLRLTMATASLLREGVDPHPTLLDNLPGGYWPWVFLCGSLLCNALLLWEVFLYRGLLESFCRLHQIRRWSLHRSRPLPSTRPPFRVIVDEQAEEINNALFGPSPGKPNY